MRVTSTALEGLLIIDPQIFADERGLFAETWSSDRYAAAGIPTSFAQDNVSRSTRGVLRGLHLQHPHEQGKLVHAAEGEVYDVAVDVRMGSPTFGAWFGYRLSGDSLRQLYVPEGFAHGFCVTSSHAVFSYKCTASYSRENELGIRWDDPDLAIPWPVSRPILSEKDATLPFLRDIPPGRLPVYRERP